MLAVVNEIHFKDGDYIFKEGTYGDWIYVVISGQVEISKCLRGQKIVIETLREGDVFGEMSFIDKTPRSASAVAKGSVTIGILDRELLDYEFNKLSQDIRAVFKALVNRLRETTSRISTLSGRQDFRVAKVFDIQFKTSGDFRKAYSTNIGGGGLLIKAEESVPLGTKCLLRFNLPGDKQLIEVNSQIVWASLGSDKNKQVITLGLKFLDLKAGDKQRIDKYVHTNLKSE